MFNPFKKQQSVLEEMAADEVEEQPPLVPDTPPPFTSGDGEYIIPTSSSPNEEDKVCPDCGTTDCLSLEEYQSHLKMSGFGGYYINPKYILQSCSHRRTLNKMRKIEKNNPGIWGFPSSSNMTVSIIRSTEDNTQTGSTGPK